jgi:hypothetical protein
VGQVLQVEVGEEDSEWKVTPKLDEGARETLQPDF